MTRESHTIGWILYDVANSAYHLMMPTVLMPILFSQYYFADREAADFLWALVVSVPVLLAGIASPILGAYLDSRNWRLRGLVASAAGSILLGAGIIVCDRTHPVAAALLFGGSYFLFVTSLSLYDSLLPFISRAGSRGSLSGVGWGLGYLGGIAALIVTYPFLSGATLPADIGGFRSSIMLVCLIFTAATIAAFLLLRRSEESNRVATSDPPEGTGTRLRRQLTEWKSDWTVPRIIVSYYLANDGLATLTYFTAIYATATLGFTSTQVLSLFLIVQVVGIPSAIVAGRAADRWGGRRVLLVCLSLWVVLTCGYAVASGVEWFYAISFGTGLVIGSTPAVFRAMLADQIGRREAATVFGFNSLASRASSVLGPLLFGAIAAWTGSQRWAVLTLVAFFAFSAITLPRGLIQGRTPVEAA